MNREKTLYNAVYYERVSTIHDEQTTSMDNQSSLRESYLKRHPEINLVAVFSERISGKSDLRPEFNKMIRLIEKGNIQYILVKDLKRLSRSSEVSAQLRTVLKKHGCKLILLSTGEIYDPNADDKRMVYGFESLVNEEVVYRQSEYARLAHRQKMEAKRLSPQNVRFGFMWDYQKDDMVIKKVEAEVLIEVFDMYVFQDKGIGEIRKYLASIGYARSAVTINKWLRDTSCIGIFCMNKMGSELGVGVGQKTRRYKNPEDEWVLVYRPDLAFVDSKVFDLAQRIKRNRQGLFDADKNGLLQARFRGFHLFSSKLFCGECGRPFVHGWADRACTVGVYKDSFRYKRIDDPGECLNQNYRRVYESEMAEIVIEVINKLLEDNQDCFLRLMKIVKKVFREENGFDKTLRDPKKRFAAVQKRQEKIKQAYLDTPPGALRQSLLEDFERTEKELLDLEREINQLQIQGSNEESVLKRLAEIQNALNGLKQIDTLDRQTVEHFVYKMTLNNEGDLKIILNTDMCLKSQIKVRKQGHGGSAFVVSGADNSDREKIGKKSVVKMLRQDIQDSPPATAITRRTCFPVWKP